VNRSGDRGAATVLLVAMLGVVLVVASAGAAIARVAAARVRVSTAADLAALAAARAGDCKVAAAVAIVNGATGAQCRLDGLDAQVRAVVTVQLLPGKQVQLTALARAGPPP
jgi:secretion/DNA translocation related TadE-like protein